MLPRVEITIGRWPTLVEDLPEGGVGVGIGNRRWSIAARQGTGAALPILEEVTGGRAAGLRDELRAAQDVAGESKIPR